MKKKNKKNEIRLGDIVLSKIVTAIISTVLAVIVLAISINNTYTYGLSIVAIITLISVGVYYLFPDTSKIFDKVVTISEWTTLLASIVGCILSVVNFINNGYCDLFITLLSICPFIILVAQLTLIILFGLL